MGGVGDGVCYGVSSMIVVWGVPLCRVSVEVSSDN